MKINQPLCVLCIVSLSVELPLMLIGSLAIGQEQLPAGLNVTSIEARPTAVELKGRFEYRQLLITGKLDSGETVDLTRMAKVTQAGKVANVSADGVVRGAADGSDELGYTFNNHSVKVPVAVSGLAAAPAVSFVRDVAPVLSRMGCNAGTCHGAKEGKAGFKLSLRGYDPVYDHRALTDDIGDRRFNRSAPDQSMMLLKATGSIPHVGGVRTEVGHPYYDLVL